MIVAERQGHLLLEQTARYHSIARVSKPHTLSTMILKTVKYILPITRVIIAHSFEPLNKLASASSILGKWVGRQPRQKFRDHRKTTYATLLCTQKQHNAHRQDPLRRSGNLRARRLPLLLPRRNLPRRHNEPTRRRPHLRHLPLPNPRLLTLGTGESCCSRYGLVQSFLVECCGATCCVY